VTVLDYDGVCSCGCDRILMIIQLSLPRMNGGKNRERENYPSLSIQNLTRRNPGAFKDALSSDCNESIRFKCRCCSCT